MMMTMMMMIRIGGCSVPITHDQHTHIVPVSQYQPPNLPSWPPDAFVVLLPTTQPQTPHLAPPATPHLLHLLQPPLLPPQEEEDDEALLVLGKHGRNSLPLGW